MPRITFSEHSGSSFEDAIIISGVWHSGEGMPAEFVYLARRFGRIHLDWRLKGYALLVLDRKFCDRVWIEQKDGTEEIIYFDVTAFILNPIADADKEAARQVLSTSLWSRTNSLVRPFCRMVAYSSVAAIFVAITEQVFHLDYANPDATPLWLMFIPVGVLILTFREQIMARLTPIYKQGVFLWLKRNVLSREGAYSVRRAALVSIVALGLLIRGLL